MPLIADRGLEKLRNSIQPAECSPWIALCVENVVINFSSYVTLIHLKKWIKFGVNSGVNSGVNTGLNT